MQGTQRGGARRRAWSAIVAMVVLTGGMVGFDALPAGADASITSSGPLTQVGVGSNLDCSANHTGDSFGEFYNGTSCGTWTVVDGTLYGPPLQATGYSSTAYTAVSQTAVTGTGTNADPFKVVTVVDAGATGVRLTQTDTYTVGLESFRTDVAVANTSGASRTIRVYRAADCFLQDSDSGFGSLDTGTGAVACTTGLTAGSRIEQWFPITAGSKAYEDQYSLVYAKISGNQAFDDTCGCSTQQDNGAGLSWDATLAASANKTFSSLITFSPLGIQPLSMSITPDAASVGVGGTAGYTITVHNPNATAVNLSSLSDVIPASFTYVAGSTTGMTTANPTIGSGNTLTWAGPLAVPATGDGTLHFSASVGTTTGTFTSSASATNGDGFTIAPSGADGAVTVTGGPPVFAASLAPASQSVPVSGSATLTATATRGGTPESGHQVDFAVQSGPHAGATATGTTNASGQATFTLNGTTTGTDSVKATVHDGATTVTTNSATVTWTPVGGSLTVTGTTAPSTITAGSIARTRFTIRNNGEGPVGNAAASITLPAGATPISITPSSGGCSGFSGGTATCLFGRISAGGTRGITVLYQSAPTSSGPFKASIGVMSDGGNASTAAGPTVVAPTPGRVSGFVLPGGSISLGNDPTAANPLVATFKLPRTGSGAPITLRVDTAGAGTFCGGHPCAGRRILFLSPFTGYSDPNRPPELTMVWDKSIVGTSTSFPIYIQKQDNGPIVTIANCRNYGDEDHPDVADPHPCVELRKRRSNDDVEAHIFLLSGDPRIAR